MRNRVRFIIQIIIAVVLVISARLCLRKDFLPFMHWWLVLFVLGVIFLPFAHKLFSRSHDNGFLFSKVIGIALSGYLMWLLSSLRLMKFSGASCVIIVLFCFAANLILFGKSSGEDRLSIFNRRKINAIVTEELVFFAIFLIWTYIRGFKPEAYGTEKFMDYGFMTSMMRADYMPPQDLWFAGHTINYYYVGQFIATYMTKLSFVPVNAGYNLMLMTLAAFTFVLPCSLVYNITKNHYEYQGMPGRKAPLFAGILSGAGVSLAGNMHFSLFYWIIPGIKKFIGTYTEKDKYWFPDSTRYIGYNPDTADKTIHEFPAYSFVLGDLHAHVINIMFVITLLAILYAWLQYRRELIASNRRFKLTDALLVKELYNPYIIMSGFLIGLFHTTNFWDFPIYYVVAGAVILFCNAIVYRFEIRTIWITTLQGIVVMAVAKLTALPFTLNFDQISTEVYLAVDHTPFYQLVILWGLPVTVITGFFMERILAYRIRRREGTNRVPEGLKTEKPVGRLRGFLYDLSITDLFVLTVGLCAIGLVLIPEVIYVKDIYSGDYKRANTMFKLTYQAFIMFGIASGYIFVKFLKGRRGYRRKIFAGITLLFFLSSLWYTKVAVAAWYGNIFNSHNYKGLDAAAFMQTVMPDDYLAVEWLNNNIQGTPVILEANGESYTDYERISVMTGLPTVAGWYVHEWLWRGSHEVVDGRAADIETIYTSADREQVLKLIDRYRVEYICVGKLEYEKYTDVNTKLLKNLGDVVFSSPASAEKDYETYIIHVEPKG